MKTESKIDSISSVHHICYRQKTNSARSLNHQAKQSPVRLPLPIIM